MVDTEDKLYEGETCYFTFICPKMSCSLFMNV